MQDTETRFNISAVERETGLSKDVLRIWERRYGFPHPGRDENAERQYTAGIPGCGRANSFRNRSRT